MMVEWPMTCHPSLERIAPQVRKGIDGGDFTVMVAAPVRTAFVRVDEEIKPFAPSMPEPVPFTVKRACGMAPFVGDPRTTEAMYEWKFAQDRAGRWVASDCELEWRRR